MKSSTHKEKHPSFLRVSAYLLLVATVVAVIVCATLAYRLFFADLFLDSAIVTVPDLVGKPLDREAIPNAALYQIVRIEEYSDAPLGTVLKQSPAAGSERKAVEGKHYVTLTLYVSKGEETASVPPLVGLSAQTGELRLNECGFDTKIVKTYSSRPQGEIVGQTPDPSTVLKTGETVTLKVSGGPSVKMAEIPSVTGLSQTRAESLLQAYGLKTGSIRYRETQGAEGVVLSQSSHAAASLPRGSAVDLVVSRHPIETTAPPETEAEPSESSNTPPVAEKSPAERDTERGESNSESASPEDLIDRILEKYLPELR